MEALLPVSHLVPVFLKPVFPSGAPEPEPENDCLPGQFTDEVEDKDVRAGGDEVEGRDSHTWGRSAGGAQSERSRKRSAGSVWYHCPHCRSPIELVNDSAANYSDTDSPPSESLTFHDV